MNERRQIHLIRAITTFCTESEIRKLSDKDVLVHELFGNKIAELLYHVMDPATHKTSFPRGGVGHFLRPLQKCYWHYAAAKAGLSKYLDRGLFFLSGVRIVLGRSYL